MRTTVVLVVAAMAALMGATAEAQRYGGRGGWPKATLHQFPQGRGDAYSFTGEATNLPKYINDWAMSGTFRGRWLVCEHSDFRGHCAEVSGRVNLADYGLERRVSSLKPIDQDRGWDR